MKELYYTLAEVKNVANKWLYFDKGQDIIIDVMFAVHLANRLEGDPVWMLFIAPPSSAKTELLRAFDGRPDVYLLSSLTPSTFISGRVEQEDDCNHSLLPKLNGKTLIIKEFTTILSKRSEQQQEIIAQLREVYDGRYTKAFGTGKTIDWEGKVGLMAACTPVYDKHYGVIGSMGDRFMLFRMTKTDGLAMGRKAQACVGREPHMREEIKQAFHRFLIQFDKMKKVEFHHIESFDDKVLSLACFCAQARCPVLRDYRSRSIEYGPQPEGPARLVKQFTQIGRGLALVHDKHHLGNDEYEILKEIGLNLINPIRQKVVRFLWEAEVFEQLQRWKTAKEIADDIAIPLNTMKIALEDLMMVGVLGREKAGKQEKAPYQWQIRKNAYASIRDSGVFGRKFCLIQNVH